MTVAEARTRLDDAERAESFLVAAARRHLGCERFGRMTILAAAEAHEKSRAAFEEYLKALSIETTVVVRAADAKDAALARAE